METWNKSLSSIIWIISLISVCYVLTYTNIPNIVFTGLFFALIGIVNKIVNDILEWVLIYDKNRDNKADN